ncbi:MAG TPA: hypothetical protein VHO69_06865, partial [Phototrophicaceae bacterium]|nr:hypothetical protein [Phototrophicaceae bacterium]
NFQMVGPVSTVKPPHAPIYHWVHSVSGANAAGRRRLKALRLNLQSPLKAGCRRRHWLPSACLEQASVEQ